MNAEGLLAYYEKIADAPNAIARLRRFIRDLAVRGKLVPRDANDEAAWLVLPRIKVRGRIDGAFALPASWVWREVDSVADARLGKMLDKAKNKGTPRPYLRNLNVRWFDFELSDLAEMPFEESELDEFKLRRGDVLICEGGEPGRAAVWDERAQHIYFQKAIHRVRFAPVVDPFFFVHSLKASADDGRLSESFTGTGIKHFTGKGLGAYRFPLPPVAEQRRIVAKIDELVSLCDRFEAARERREAVRHRLVAASLARLNAPDSETLQEDARFVIKALPVLATRPDQIKQLRQTILNLAVRGKLVPQDPNDEPASELLKRIANEKAKATGRNKLLPRIEDAEKTFDVPESWYWVRMGDVFSIRTGFAFKSSTYADKGTLVFRVTNFDRDGSFDLSDAVFFPTEKIDAKMSGFLLEPGEIIMVMVGGTIGKTAIVDESVLPALLNQNMWRIRSFGRIMSSKFEYLLIKNINQSIQGLTQSTHGHFAMSDYEKRIFPLPPLAEQHRIVAKADALMALCDKLEASLTAAAATRRRLLEAVLAEAMAPAKARELEAAE